MTTPGGLVVLNVSIISHNYPLSALLVNIFYYYQCPLPYKEALSSEIKCISTVLQGDLNHPAFWATMMEHVNTVVTRPVKYPEGSQKADHTDHSRVIQIATAILSLSPRVDLDFVEGTHTVSKKMR